MKRILIALFALLPLLSSAQITFKRQGGVLYYKVGSGAYELVGYQTPAQVLSTTLTGYSTATNRPVVATDNVVTALGLVQAQLNTSAVAIDPTFAVLTYAATANYPYTITRPNAQLTVTGNTTINLTGTVNGDAGYLRITKTSGSEVVTFPGRPPAPLKTIAGGVDLVWWNNNAGTIEWLLGESNADVTNASSLTTGTVNDNRLSANVTKAGNSFNGNSQLVQTTSAGKLPALDGSLLTNLPSGGSGGSGYTQFVSTQRILGAEIKYESSLGSLPAMRDAFNIGAGRTQLIPFIVTTTDLLSGVGVYITNPGSYTGSLGDGVAIYSAGAAGSTVLTRVASSTLNSTLFTAAVGHLKVAFTSTYSAAPGVYYIAISHDRSAVATQPELLATGELREFTTGLPGAKLWASFVYGTTLPATINVADMNLFRTPVYSYTY